MVVPYIAMAKAGDFIKAARLLVEAVYQLPPDGFDSLPWDWQTGLLDNARVVPLLCTAPPPPAITCDQYLFNKVANARTVAVWLNGFLCGQA
jgi:hypothetical protein